MNSTRVIPRKEAGNASRRVKAQDTQIMGFGKSQRITDESPAIKAQETQFCDGQCGMIPGPGNSGLVECTKFDMKDA
jgi:hypothetical protein